MAIDRSRPRNMAGNFIDAPAVMFIARFRGSDRSSWGVVGEKGFKPSVGLIDRPKKSCVALQVPGSTSKSPFHFPKIAIFEEQFVHIQLLLVARSSKSRRDVRYGVIAGAAIRAGEDAGARDLTPRKNNNRLRHLSIIASNCSWTSNSFTN
jgi:hypothetical protein